MGKIIAVCGSPASGKTTAALKIAQEIYAMNAGSVLYISPDMTVPSLAYIFPSFKDGELYSLGAALDRTDIFQDDVLQYIVSTKDAKNFGYMGFKLGENRYTYPRVTEDKVLSFFRVAAGIGNYVVIDCSCDHDDLVSTLAKSRADEVVMLVNPDLKCLSYFGSNADQFSAVADKAVKVMNIVDKDLYLPIRDIQNHYKDISFTLPYSRAIKQQAIAGTLSERLGDKRYISTVKGIAKAVI